MLALALGYGVITLLANVLGAYLAVLRRAPSQSYMVATLGLGEVSCWPPHCWKFCRRV